VHRSVVLHGAAKFAILVDMVAAETPLVFVVDDDPSVRKSLTRLLKGAGWEVESFASGHEFLAQPRPDRPSCLLLDVRMPGLTGPALQDALAGLGERLSIVFLTGYGDVRVGVRAMKGGAVDVLTKPVSKEELLDAVERAVAIALRDRREQARIKEIRDRIKMLTPREARVFALVVTGTLNKQSAVELGVVEKTIKVHRARVMEKMQAGSLAELVQLAAEAGVFAAKSGHPPS
jgi:FixJ family two-component response regulator